MKDLGRDARELLDAATDADRAPLLIRHRARQRFVGALAAGSLTTSAIVAKGATLGAAGATTTGTTSLAATLASAVVLGLSTGLVAISPTSQRIEMDNVAVPESPTKAPATPLPKRMVVAVPASPQLPTSTAEAAPLNRPRIPLVRRAAAADRSPQPDEETPQNVTEPPKPTKASIARETELIAEVQRALKGGRALLALATLDRYAEECPARMLNEEATASRVVALCALGRNAEGQRLGEIFARQYPNSPLSSRVRSACPHASPLSGSRMPHP